MVTQPTLPSIGSFIQLAVLMFARVLPIISITPVFGGASVPKRLRTGLAATLTLPLVLASVGTARPSVDASAFALLLGKETLIGLTFAIFLLVTFDLLGSTGFLIDTARGVTFSSVLDPIHGNTGSPLSVFFGLLFVVLFLSLGGYGLILSALADSFVVLPVHEMVPSRFIGPSSLDAVLRTVGDVFSMVVRLAAPAIIFVLMIDLALGLLNRVSPQIEAYFIGMEVKAWLGLFVVLISTGVMVGLAVRQFAKVLSEIFRLFGGQGA